MTWPPLVIWLLILAAVLSRGPLILYLFSITVIFGGLTMAPPGLTGGLNLPAQTICAAILIAKILVRSDNLMVMLRHTLDIRKLGLLAVFAVYILVTSVLYPRLFRGDVLLYSLNAAAKESPLHPTSANFTQTMYLLISLGTTFAFGVASRNPQFRQHYMRSVLLAGVLLFGSGIVDLALNAVGASSLLEPFHNASYNLLDTQSIAGQHRVVGFMPEASVYGAACCFILAYLVFNFEFFEPKFRKHIVPALIVSLAVITFLSTSSTGYVGLIVLGAVAASRIFLTLVLIPIRSASQLQRTAYIFASLGAMVVLLALFGPYFIIKYNHLLNVVLFNKTGTSSYLERARWTHAGLQAFFTTHGIGVGVGSVRTSNWFVNILASTGVVGVGLFGAFVAKMLLPFQAYPNTGYNRFATGMKLTLLPAAVMIGISGTTPDPGVWVMSIFGMLYGLRLKPQNIELVDGQLRSEYRANAKQAVL